MQKNQKKAKFATLSTVAQRLVDVSLCFATSGCTSAKPVSQAWQTFKASVLTES